MGALVVASLDEDQCSTFCDAARLAGSPALVTELERLAARYKQNSGILAGYRPVVSTGSRDHLLYAGLNARSDLHAAP
jgi:hypothetical protein